ncbi:MAG: helix-turn-helix domain-containing protein [Leucobacter sp.]
MPSGKGDFVEVLSTADSQKYQAILDYIRNRAEKDDEPPHRLSAREEYEVSTHRKQRQHCISPAESKQIIEQFLAGKNTTELAAAFGCSRTTISRHIHKVGLSAREKRFTEEQLREMERLYETGLSLDKVGDQFGTSGTTATKYLRERGVRIRGRYEWHH